MTVIEITRAIQRVVRANRWAKLSDLMIETELTANQLYTLRFPKLSAKMRASLEEDRLPVANAFALQLCPDPAFEDRALTEDPNLFVPSLWSR